MLSLYTSGSTSAPKKVVHSWSLIHKCAIKSIQLYSYSYTSHVLNMYPIQSIAYHTLTSNPAKIADATVHDFMWNPYEFYKVHSDLKPTHIGCTPRQIDILSKIKSWKNINLENTKIIIGGEKVEQYHLDLLHDKKAKVFVTYGSTEFPPAFMTGIDSQWLTINDRCKFIDSELLIDNKPTGDLFEVSNNKCKFIKRKVESDNITWKNKL